MRILHIYNLNHVAEIYCNDLEIREHSTYVYKPSLIGAHMPLIAKVAMMPWRLFDLHRITNSLTSKYFDIVHIHWASYGILGLISKVPFVIHCHGSDVRYRLQNPFFRALLTPIFKKAAAVICITPELLPIVQTIRSDAFFFPGPVNTEQFSPRTDREKDATRPWTILLFTRLDPIKGPEMALQGIAKFTERHPETRVLVLDWGLLKEHYKQRYGKHFKFIPVVPADKVQELIWSADVVVGQCKLGILSLCELQAMSCAKPVVIPSFYEEAYPSDPPICQATSPEEIEAQLENLFHHSEIGTALGQKAREWVLQNHGHQNLASRLEALYLSILAEQPGRQLVSSIV